MIEISQSKESHCRTNTSVSEERNKFKRAGLWESQPRIWVGKLAIWVRSFEITQFTRSISSIRTGKPVLVMSIKASKDKHISRCVDWENLIYVRWNRIKDLSLGNSKIKNLDLWKFQMSFSWTLLTTPLETPLFFNCNWPLEFQ